jgi:sugar (pentulose or hexulose) kinase
MRVFLGIDPSTTATKALLIDETGRVVGVASTQYAYETPRPQWSRQDPALWWQATVQSLRQVLAESKVIRPPSLEAAAYRAALLAATGTGAFPDVASACAAVIRITGTYEPGPASEIYQDIYSICCDLYPALRPSFSAIALAGN